MIDMAASTSFSPGRSRPDTRPIAAGTSTIASPVDGTVSECGAIDRDSLLQAKGRHYTLGELLAGQPWARRFEGGSFATSISSLRTITAYTCRRTASCWIRRMCRPTI